MEKQCSVHVSRVEEVIQAEELLFEATPAFGKWKNLFPKKAVEFPAKANLNLVQFLIEEFTMKGDTVLDPMGGTGSTAVMASLQGRHGVIVELEKKYVGWALEAKRRTEATLGEKGEIKIIQGDSHELSKVLSMVDSIITSPPYAESLNALHRSSYCREPNEITKEKNLPRAYSTNETNIGNLPSGNVDAVITSPPYENQVHSASGGIRDKLSNYKVPGQLSMTYGYSIEKNNIGNLKRESYFDAMRQVYEESYKVLKPNGRIIIILKNFIRNKQVVDLVYDSYRLLKSIGFKLEKVYKLKLENKSFWRILYQKKYPSVPVIGHEYCLIFRKP